MFSMRDFSSSHFSVSHGNIHPNIHSNIHLNVYIYALNMAKVMQKQKVNQNEV